MTTFSRNVFVRVLVAVAVLFSVPGSAMAEPDELAFNFLSNGPNSVTCYAGMVDAGAWNQLVIAIYDSNNTLLDYDAVGDAYEVMDALQLDNLAPGTYKCVAWYSTDEDGTHWDGMDSGYYTL